MTDYRGEILLHSCTGVTVVTAVAVAVVVVIDAGVISQQ